jgi:hypothetical protein
MRAKRNVAYVFGVVVILAMADLLQRLIENLSSQPLSIEDLFGARTYESRLRVPTSSIGVANVTNGLGISLGTLAPNETVLLPLRIVFAQNPSVTNVFAYRQTSSQIYRRIGAKGFGGNIAGYGAPNVVVGTSQFFLGGERIPVAAIHVHPKYVDQTHDFDFALLRLTRPVTMGGSAVTRPIDPADANAQIPDGTKAFVSGWGAVSEGGPGSLDLLGVEIPVVSTDVCNNPESYGGDVTANMLCAGRESGGADSCQGDSGGPLTAKLQERITLIGVVSFGEGCARRLKFGVYARVPVAASWIAATMKK